MRALSAVRRFVKRDEGQDLIEYGILASLIAVAAIGVLSTVGTRVATLWDTLTDFF